MHTLKEIDENDFNAIIKNKKSAVVEFSAKWCSACKLTEPVVSDVALKHPDIIFSKIDVAKNPGLASKMGVMSLPNIFIIKKGKIADQIIGATSEKILENKIK